MFGGGKGGHTDGEERVLPGSALYGVIARMLHLGV